MSQGILYLHSHSGIERNVKELAKDKFHVLVDEVYKYLFDDSGDVHLFVYNNKRYYKVPTYAFFQKGGIFKNLDS